MTESSSKEAEIVAVNSYQSSSESQQNGQTLVIVDNISGRKWLVGVVVFLFMASCSISTFVFGRYLYIKLQRANFLNKPINSATSYCNVNESDPDYQIQLSVQKQTTHWAIYYYLAGGIHSMVANFVLGSYTDRFGRKFLFYLACFGPLIRTVVATIAIHYDLDLIYHVPGYIIEGCTGGFYGLIQVSFIYIADITKPGKQMSYGIALVELSIGLGLGLLSFATGYFMEAEGFLYPMITSSAAMGAAVLAVVFLPETYPKIKRRKQTSKLGTLTEAYDLYFSSKNRGRRWMYCTMLAVFIFTTFTAFSRAAIEKLYELNSPFCWKPKDLGWFGTLVIIIQNVFGMLMLKLLQKCFSDESVAMLGTVSLGAAFVLEGLAANKVELYLVPVVRVFGMLTIPMSRAILSRMTTSDKQGAVFASIAAAETLNSTVSSILSNIVYAETVGVFRGAIFMVYAGCNCISLMFLIIFVVGTRRKRYQYDVIPEG